MKKVYYAHPTTEYDTKRERQIIEWFEKYYGKNFEIVNPNTPYHCEQYKNKGMNYFVKLVDKCDCLIYTRFKNNRIGAGVTKEIDQALKK